MMMEMSGVEMNAEYLVELSRQVETVSKHYQEERLGPLTHEFSSVLTDNFADLSQLLSLYADDPVMKDFSVLRCKANLELYVWEKAAALLNRDRLPLATLCQQLIAQFRSHLHSSQTLLLADRRWRTARAEGEKERVMGGLRREVEVKREYCQELEERVHELEDENSKLYSKLITSAKHTVDYSLHAPPRLRRLLVHPIALSLALPPSPKRRPSPRATEEEILEIMEAKQRQEGVQEKHVPMDEFLKSYFAVKYGRPLAEQHELQFRETVVQLARQQDNPLFALFAAIVEEDCEEAYFAEHRALQERLIRALRRYLHEKYGRPLSELDRQLDPRDDRHDCPLAEHDLEPLLSLLYRPAEADSLLPILAELLGGNSKLSARRLIQEILKYELRKHLMRIEDVLRQIGKVMEPKERTIGLAQLQKVLLKVVNDKARWQLLQREDPQRRYTLSQAVETIQRIRTAKLPRKD